MSTSPQFKILYIDDDAPNRKLVRKLLQAEGYAVSDAANGFEGIEQAEKNPPDLILMDINMPGLDGCEATTRLKTNPSLSEVPIVAITAAGALTGIRERALAAGCVGYIRKPVDVDHFAEEVGSYLKGKRDKLAPEEEGRQLRDYSQHLVGRLEGTVRALQQANQQLEANLEEVAAARDAAVRSNRVKTEFLNVMSHEMRTPLNAILGFSELLLEEWAAGPEEQVSSLQAIHDGGTDLLRLVNRILDYVRMEGGDCKLNWSMFDLGDLLRQVVKANTTRAQQKGLELDLLQCEPGGFAYADLQRIHQVLDELIHNAIAFSDHGEISVECLQQAAPAGAPHAREQVVRVRDSGPGIAEDERPHLFDVFRQTDGSIRRSQGGLGLGLALAKRIMAAHGGRIEYEPAEGGGSVFSIALPVREDESEMGAA